MRREKHIPSPPALKFVRRFRTIFVCVTFVFRTIFSYNVVGAAFLNKLFSLSRYVKRVLHVCTPTCSADVLNLIIEVIITPLLRGERFINHQNSHTYGKRKHPGGRREGGRGGAPRPGNRTGGQEDSVPKRNAAKQPAAETPSARRHAHQHK